MKIALFMLVSLSIVGCATSSKTAPTAKEQVAGLKKMCGDSAEAMKARQTKESLYSRLGGKKKIKEFSANLYGAHTKNKEIGYRFKYVKKKQFVRRVTDFLTVNSGGKGKYDGADMKQVHINMNITNADFLVAGGDVEAVMKEMGVGENEIQESICFLVSLMPLVVAK